MTETAPDTRDVELDEEVRQYREAIKAGTLCDYCLRANPPGSRYCEECGRSLR